MFTTEAKKFAINTLKRIAICVVLSVQIPNGAMASPVTYNFTVEDLFLLHNNSPRSDIVTGSFVLDGTNLTAFDMTLEGLTYDLTNVGMHQYNPRQWVIGGLLNGPAVIDTATIDFNFSFDPTNLNFFGMDYSNPNTGCRLCVSTVGEVTIQNKVPEPHALTLIALALLGVVATRRLSR